MVKRHISIVVPIYNEAANISRLHRSLNASVPDGYIHEIIFVDDGSQDESLEIIKSICETDPATHYVALSRNFGHQLALKAGIDVANGDCTITIDADFQHPVEMIPQMIQAWEEGAEVVSMLRKDSGKFSFKVVSGRMFYWLINKVIDFPIQPGSADFRLTDKLVTDQLKELRENTIFFRGIIPWMGFRQHEISYTPKARHAGESKYNIRKMLNLALTGFISSSTKPLRLTSYLGLAIALFASLYAFYAIIIKLVVGTAISGWTSLLISLLLLGGTQLIMLGIIGEYLGKSLVESKGRPNYIIREQSNVIVAPDKQTIDSHPSGFSPYRQCRK